MQFKSNSKINSIKLSKRLESIYQYVKNEREHDVFWDICCDHGHLALKVAQHALVKKVILIDKVAGIIEKVKQTVLVTDIPVGVEVSAFAQDGRQLKIDSDQQNLILICGIGGLLLIDMLVNMDDQINDEQTLILSPHRSTVEVRAKLQMLGYGLVEEKLVSEGRHFYEILKVSKKMTNKIPAVGEFFTQNTDDTNRYLQQMIEYFEIKSKYGNDVISKEILKKYELIEIVVNKLR